MRTWERTRVVEGCGNCAKTLAIGTPVQVLHLAAIARRRIRCEGCADGPLDLEALERFDIVEEGRRASKSKGIPIAFAFTGHTKPLFDAKVAQVGERE